MVLPQNPTIKVFSFQSFGTWSDVGMGLNWQEDLTQKNGLLVSAYF